MTILRPFISLCTEESEVFFTPRAAVDPRLSMDYGGTGLIEYDWVSCSSAWNHLSLLAALPEDLSRSVYSLVPIFELNAMLEPSIRRGMSLLEVSVVAMIFAIGTAVAIPSIQKGINTRSNAAGKEVAADFQSLRPTCVATRNLYICPVSKYGKSRRDASY